MEFEKKITSTYVEHIIKYSFHNIFQLTEVAVVGTTHRMTILKVLRQVPYTVSGTVYHIVYITWYSTYVHFLISAILCATQHKSLRERVYCARVRSLLILFIIHFFPRIDEILNFVISRARWAVSRWDWSAIFHREW